MKKLRHVALWWMFRTLCRGVAWLGHLLYGIEAQGLDQLPQKGPLVVVGRRISRVDFLGAAFLCSRGIGGEVSGITGIFAVCNSRLLAWMGQQLGISAALRGKGLSVGSMIGAYNLLKQGKIIANADEAEIPWDGRLQHLKSGAAWLALRAHAPVVAVMMHGGYDIWPRWARWPHLSGKLIIKVSKPFYLSEAPCNRVTDDILQMANRRILTELESLSDGYMLRKGSRP